MAHSNETKLAKTVLLVDDEADITELVKYNLQKEGFTVLTARNGTQALEQAQSITTFIDQKFSLH